VKDALSIPVVTIGGINKENCVSVVRGGADSLVAISAIVCSDDVKRESKDFIEIIGRTKHDLK
jgi:thiamine-phosphate pyrophosphorylase